MIKSDILSYLSKITDEERLFIAGKKDIDKSIYSSENKNVVNSRKLLSQGKLITIRPHTRFVHFPTHTHDYIEAVYMCKGETTHIINGEKITLAEGDFLLLGQNVKQEILPAEENDIAVNFIILPQFFDKTLEMLSSIETPITSFLKKCLFDNSNDSYLLFRLKDILPVTNLIENLLRSLMHETRESQNINKTTMGLIFMYLSENTDRLIFKNNNEKTVYKVLNYIEDNYRDGTLFEIADILHYDFSRLSHDIKTQTGKTYTDLVQQKRLSVAVYLLCNTKLSIEEISAAIGYNNKSYFHRIFKNEYGISPKKYRNITKTPEKNE